MPKTPSKERHVRKSRNNNHQNKEQRLHMPSPADMVIQKSEQSQPNRGIVFERDKQRNAQYLQKGLTKPGRVSYDTLRRAAGTLHIARICINVLKSRITRTPWIVRQRDPKIKIDKKQIQEVTDLLQYPNDNSETFRTLLDKMVEDLLVLDAVTLEKTRYPDGKLAELHFIDSATIRPVYDQYGNQDVDIPLQTEPDSDEKILPVSYVQILDNSQYGGPESGSIIAAWPKRDMIHFHQYPQGSMEGFGYGLSPLEGVISVVANLLNTDNYNMSFFEEGAFPPIILHVQGNVNQRDAETFREYMTQEMTGHFYRPAFMAGGEKMEVINLKSNTNRDMEFMQYTEWLAKLMTAAYGLSPQDIGMTDDVNRSTGQVMQDLSNQKGYSAILDLFRQVINQQIIWKDFGYTDIEFDWVDDENMSEKDASEVYDKALRNGTMTVNEVREKIGALPYEDEFNKPMVLGPNGYQPMTMAEAVAENDKQKPEESEEDAKNQKPPKNEDAETVEKSFPMEKMVFTDDGKYKTWVDDRGYGQPFIWVEIKTGDGMVYKPPVAVNLDSSFELEENLTKELSDMGLNVYPVYKKTFVEIVKELREKPEVLAEFYKYCNMDPDYDSMKWRSKHGGSRKFPFYECTTYIDGFHLNDPLLIDDMKRVPEKYEEAVKDLKRLWIVEKDMVLGDRRADQYIITHDKRAWGFDYQFKGDERRWERTKDAIPQTLEAVPALLEVFETYEPKKKSILKSLLSVYN